MIEPTLSVIVFVILIISAIYIKNKYNNYIDQYKNYEIYTKPLIENIIFSYVFLVLSELIIILSIILHYSSINDGYIACLILGLIFGILSLSIMILSYFNTGAIDNNYIYYYKLFRINKINISDIKYIYSIGIEVTFFDIKKQKLFILQKSKETEEIINKIKQNNKVYYNLTGDKDIYDIKNSLDLVSISKYEELGNDIKDKKGIYRKRFKSIITIVSLLYLLMVILLCVFIHLALILLIVPGLIIVPIFYGMVLSNYEEKFLLNDFELGYLHFMDAKIYKGHAKKKFKDTIKVSSVWGIFFFIIGIICLIAIINFKPTDYNTLKTVEGTLESYYKNTYSKNNYIAFKIKESDYEYRIGSIYVDEFDASFFSENNEGCKVKFLIDEKVHQGKNTKTKEDCNYVYIYYMKCNNYEYFGYDDMLKGEIDNINVAKYACYFSFTGITIIIGINVVSYLNYKNNKKKEVIEV